MSENSHEHKQVSVLPYDWWIAGVAHGQIHLYCSRTSAWGVVRDPEEEDLSESAKGVDITSPSSTTIPGSSIQWRKPERVTIIEPSDRKKGPAAFLRSKLIALFKSRPSRLRSIVEFEAWREAVDRLEEAVLRLDRLEFLEWYNPIARGAAYYDEEDTPF